LAYYPAGSPPAFPPWLNEYSSVIKDTSLAYAVGVIELVREGRYIILAQV